VRNHVSAFANSVTGVQDSTLAVYRRDLEAFADWLVENGRDEVTAIDRRVVRRYLAHLDGAGYARRTRRRPWLMR